MKAYTKPSITDHGDIRAITAGRTGREIDDADHKQGDFALENTTGPCVGAPKYPCTD